jgi:hypothetical protein
MAKKTRETFVKREKEKARQQTRNDKQARRFQAKERRASREPEVEQGDVDSLGSGYRMLAAQRHYPIAPQPGAGKDEDGNL